MPRNDLTQIDGEYQNVEMNGDVQSWDVGASRWRKGGNDRVYFNNTEYVDYIDLDSLTVMSDHAQVSISGRTATNDGDKLIVEVTAEDKFDHKEMKAVFQLPEELAGDDSDNTDEEIVADGGEDVSEEFDDAEIEEAIDSNGALTDVDEVRNALTDVQRSFKAVWGDHMDAVEDNALELVAMDDDALVFADHTGQFWNEEFHHGPIADIDDEARMQSVVKQLHHNWARRHTDYSWGVDDPVVVRTPRSFDAGQRLVEAVMLNLTSRELTPREAWAVWGVLAGNSRNNWADRMGYDSHSGVSNAVRDAKGKVPLPYVN